MNPLRVTVWHEYRHEKLDKQVADVYPEGIHGALAKGLAPYGFDIHTATLDEPEHGLTQEALDNTDVLTWWGHMAHEEVSDEIVDRVQERVLNGMGLIVLHSGHLSKIFRRLMGTGCMLRWREADEKERIWTVDPSHPICDGLPEYIEIDEAEMYGEHFDIPPPDTLVFISWFEGGEVFRSGCCYQRGQGKIFYFRPGHETYPIFHLPIVHKVIANAINWAKPVTNMAPVRGNIPEFMA
ncbi:MAG: ThuA domain-containing protein [Chloroflexi bacterium]|nr:ThuA domain-containing protein [Chloroflexota bacterium]